MFTPLRRQVVWERVKRCLDLVVPLDRRMGEFFFTAYYWTCVDRYRPIAGPSRSPANDFYIQQQHDASKGWQSYPHPTHGTQEEEGDFLPMEGQDAYIQTTPYHPQHPLSHPPSHHPHHFQYTNGYPVPPSTSPTAMMGQHNQHPMLHITTTSPNDGFHMHSTPVPQHYYNGPPPPRRPGMPHRHSALPPTRPAPLQRQYSLQPPPSRVMDPAGHDVFAMPPGSTPIRRPASANDFQVENVSGLDS